MKILLIEDDPDDILLLKHALDDNKMNYILDEVMEGDKASVYMQHCTVLPDVIVMDLNLPKKHGREILNDIKGNEKFKPIPLVILTTSTNDTERKQMLNNGADYFLTKPVNKAGFDAAVKIIADAAGKSSEQ